jgi:serine/threonine-protein kinase RsbW
VDPSKNWAVFIHPSTLKLASFVETLLEPVICKETAKKD